MESTCVDKQKLTQLENDMQESDSKYEVVSEFLKQVYFPLKVHILMISF